VLPAEAVPGSLMGPGLEAAERAWAEPRPAAVTWIVTFWGVRCRAAGAASA
jgi:hypothetical protein